ncbi:TetR/AcrR family transcriptional regulator [Paenibacillus sp. FSL R7-0337]|uniref:TetR/AcrR family transcriptional regulator n=1 Tax=Paenibacillus sp. FSL R7-0337 TaxID=1926588 RepID=UPI00096E7D8B|nr:TetR/AcrR family transcriptional regulator [Paenibacillus sp. FSL R7-0337]OMF97049.1 TetR family transcriptional regulator [Paenibacillus sp. FSL R7-0337]
MNKQSGKTRSPQGDETLIVNRREQILEAAVIVFAEYGYYRATTAQVAERVGISQPYIFKLFKNKEELFIAALERAFERILLTFEGFRAPKKQMLAEAIQLYEHLMETHPNELILQVQASGIRDEAIRQAMQVGMQEVTRHMEDKFTAAGFAHPEVKVSTFLANAMLCNMALTLGMPELKPKRK